MVELIRTSKRVSLLGLCFMALFLWAQLQPEPFWSIHYWAFLPVKWLILLSLVLIVTFISSLKIKIPDFNFFHLKWHLTLAFAMGLIFYFFPMKADFYGEAFNYAPYLGQKLNALPEGFFDPLFQFDFRPATARKSLLVIYGLISYVIGLSYAEVFKWMGVFCGMAYCLIWTWGVIKNCTGKRSRFVLVFVGISAPFSLIYYGHFDSYALVYIVILSWLLLLIEWMKSPRKLGAIILLIYLILGIKIHPINTLFIPALLLAYVNIYARQTKLHLLTQNKGMLLFILLPIFSLGAYLYFFYFQDYRDERILQNVRDFDRLFLPLFSPEPPLDRYNLLSLNHIIDYLNSLAMWSPAAWFLLIVVHPKCKNLSSDFVIKILLLTLLLFSSLLFMINPLISMPMDWDLFSIPALIFLVLILRIVSKNEKQLKSKSMIAWTLVISLASCSIFIVHNQKEALSYRYETVGKWVYKSYYEHSPKYIHSALGMLDGTPLYLERKAQLIEDLKPYALKGNDIKFAMFYTDNGIIYDRLLQDYDQAQTSFENAMEYAANYGINLYELMKLHFKKGAYTRAYSYAQKLTEQNYPDEKEAWLIALHCAIEAELYEEALNCTNSILEIDPNHQLVREIQSRLLKRDSFLELKKYFN